MEAMTYVDALVIVHDLAEQNMLSEREANANDLEDEMVRQRNAGYLASTMIASHEENLLELDQPTAPSEWPDRAWRAVVGQEMNHAVDGVMLLIELAEQVALDNDDDLSGGLLQEAARQRLAIDLTKDLLGRHGDTLRARIAPSVSSRGPRG